MTLRAITLEEVPGWEDRLDDLIEKIVERSRGELSTEYVWATIASGEWWLAVVNDGKALVIVQPIRFKTGLNLLEIIGVAGEGLDEWEDSVGELESLARELGFHRIRGRGRKGWGRVATRHGWKETGVIVERDLYNA